MSRRLRPGESPLLNRRAAALAALNARLPRGDTLAAISRDCGMTVSGLSRLARRLGYALPTGRAAGKLIALRGEPKN